MAAASIPMFHMQVAFAIGLLGVYVGWRGVIARMTGFYDLSGAVRYLLYGLVAGVFIALAVDQLILIPIIEDSSASAVSVPLGNLSLLSLLIAAVESSLALFLVGRPRVASIRASPPFGWALGLGLGSMQAAYLIVRLFDPNLTPLSPIAGFNPFSVAVAVLIALLACIGHALPATWQGNQLLEGSRTKPYLFSTLARAILSLCLVLSLFRPAFVLAAAPFVAFFWIRAQETWLPSGLTPAARQAYRRTIRQADRHREGAESRIRGEITDCEE
jgi:hypothetical protein